MFSKQNLVLDILDIFLINRHKNILSTSQRPFHVLSRRVLGDARFHCRGKTFEVTPNHLLYIPADITYKQESSGEEQLIAVHFQLLNDSSREIAVLDCGDADITEMFWKMYRIWSGKEKNYRYKCTALLYDLLARVSEDSVAADSRIEPALLRMARDFSQPLTVGELAVACCMSENYFRRIFKESMGVSPLKYINTQRVCAAKNMILSSYYTMAEIAEKCGFSEQKYFNDVFRRETGMSPGEYKRRQVVEEK